MASSGSGLVPSIPPPAGQQPNFANPECDQNADYIVLSLCVGVSTIFFFARTFTKHYIMKQVNVEDRKCPKNVCFNSLTGLLIFLSSAG